MSSNSLLQTPYYSLACICTNRQYHCSYLCDCYARSVCTISINYVPTLPEMRFSAAKGIVQYLCEPRKFTLKVCNYQRLFRELKSPVGKRQADVSMRRIQTLTRTGSVVAQVFFKFAIQRRFHHENVFIISSIFPFQDEARYDTEEKTQICITKVLCEHHIDIELLN